MTETPSWRGPFSMGARRRLARRKTGPARPGGKAGFQPASGQGAGGTGEPRTGPNSFARARAWRNRQRKRKLCARVTFARARVEEPLCFRFASVLISIRPRARGDHPDMTNYGHNETAVRLAALAGDAQIAMDKVAKGEADAIDGWLAYGAALNEARSLFPSNEQFGQWVSANLAETIHDHERAAAMWAAANADQLAEAKAASKARTLRGWHDQWKKIEQEREAARQKAEREAEAARKREEADKARAEAEALAKAEAEARAAADAAKSEEERQQAEAKAKDAAEAKAEAEKVADEAEAEIPPAEPEVDPATAKLRREIGKLTPEAMVDEIIGLRADVAERKATIKGLRDELAEVKSENAALRESEGGRSLGNALRQARAAEGRMKEHQATAARLQKQVNAQKAEITDLKRQLENKVYVL